MAWGFKTGERDFVQGYDPRRQLRRGPSKDNSKLRRDLINHYVEHCIDALLDELEARGHISALVERYKTRERCNRPQGGGWPWRKARSRTRR
jgi:hypothetical protein